VPKVKQIGPYRLHFWSADRRERPHVHVERDNQTAKFWLRPVELATQRNFSEREVRRIQPIVEEHEAEILKVWHERFDR
jgi:hypothetical protein